MTAEAARGRWRSAARARSPSRTRRPRLHPPRAPPRPAPAGDRRRLLRARPSSRPRSTWSSSGRPRGCAEDAAALRARLDGGGARSRDAAPLAGPPARRARDARPRSRRRGDPVPRAGPALLRDQPVAARRRADRGGRGGARRAAPRRRAARGPARRRGRALDGPARPDPRGRRRAGPALPRLGRRATSPSRPATTCGDPRHAASRGAATTGTTAATARGSTSTWTCPCSCRGSRASSPTRRIPATTWSTRSRRRSSSRRTATARRASCSSTRPSA